MRRAFCLFLAICLFFSGCSLSGERMREPVTFYYPRRVYQYGVEDGVIAAEQREASGHRKDLSYLLALYLRFIKSPISKAIGTLCLLPRFIPGLVAVYAMITIIRDSGVINRISLLFGYDFKPALMYHASGMIMMNLWFNIPFAALMITAGLGAIPDSVIESARDVGASKLRVFRSIILPLSVKDVVIAGTFVFMSNVGSFTTPYLMGGNSPKMLAIALFDQFNKYLNYNRAAALSVIMFLICSVSAGVYIYTNLKENEWE